MKYSVITQTINDEILGKYHTYGIMSENGYVVSDVSLEKSLVERLTERINRKNTPLEYLSYEIDGIFNLM